MRVTEQVALTKWCPFTRTYAFSVPTTVEGREVIGPAATGGPANRYINGNTIELNPDSCRCVGSECMAWVWTSREDEGANRLGTCGLAQSYALMKD